MILDVVDQCSGGDAGILQHQGVVSHRRIVDIADRHGEYVDSEHKWVGSAHGVLGVDAFCSNERQINLHGLQMEQLKVDILTRLLLFWLWYAKIVIPQLALLLLRPGSARYVREVDHSEDEVLINFDGHLLEEEREVLDVKYTIRIVLDLGDCRLEDGMCLHLLACLWNDTRVEDDGEDATIELVVDLNPLDLHVDHLVERRVGVLQLDVA